MPDQKSDFPVADIIVVCRVAWRHSAPRQGSYFGGRRNYISDCNFILNYSIHLSLLYLLTPVCCLLLPDSDQEQVLGCFHHMSDLIIQKLYPQDTVKISSEAWQEFNHFTTCECLEPIQLNSAASITTYLSLGGSQARLVAGVGRSSRSQPWPGSSAGW